jgi:hypothetical protein
VRHRGSRPKMAGGVSSPERGGNSDALFEYGDSNGPPMAGVGRW